MINWNAVQSYKGAENADASVYHMSMGSWHADASKDGIREANRAGPAKPSGKGKPRVCSPPPEGWPGGLSDKNGCHWRKGG